MGINEKTGEVFSVAAENAQVAGCTVSKAVAEVAGGYVAHFSLAAGTDNQPGDLFRAVGIRQRNVQIQGE